MNECTFHIGYLQEKNPIRKSNKLIDIREGSSNVIQVQIGSKTPCRRPGHYSFAWAIGS